jgi:hypothetical protein
MEAGPVWAMSDNEVVGGKNERQNSLRIAYSDPGNKNEEPGTAVRTG